MRRQHIPVDPLDYLKWSIRGLMSCRLTAGQRRRRAERIAQPLPPYDAERQVPVDVLEKARRALAPYGFVTRVGDTLRFVDPIIYADISPDENPLLPCCLLPCHIDGYELHFGGRAKFSTPAAGVLDLCERLWKPHAPEGWAPGRREQPPVRRWWQFWRREPRTVRQFERAIVGLRESDYEASDKRPQQPGMVPEELAGRVERRLRACALVKGVERLRDGFAAVLAPRSSRILAASVLPLWEEGYRVGFEGGRVPKSMAHELVQLCEEYWEPPEEPSDVSISPGRTGPAT